MIPAKEECMRILEENNVPQNVVRHSLMVAEFSLEIANKLKSRGINVNIELLHAAALLHDIARGKQGDHAIIGAEMLKSMGHPEVAEVARTHGLYHIPEIAPKTVEQKILFYADKRVLEDRIVSVDERFDDYRKRYADYFKKDRTEEYKYVKKIEKELGMG